MIVPKRLLRTVYYLGLSEIYSSTASRLWSSSGLGRFITATKSSYDRTLTIRSVAQESKATTSLSKAVRPPTYLDCIRPRSSFPLTQSTASVPLPTVLRPIIVIIIMTRFFNPQSRKRPCRRPTVSRVALAQFGRCYCCCCGTVKYHCGTVAATAIHQFQLELAHHHHRSAAAAPSNISRTKGLVFGCRHLYRDSANWKRRLGSAAAGDCGIRNMTLLSSIALRQRQREHHHQQQQQLPRHTFSSNISMGYWSKERTSFPLSKKPVPICLS